MADRLRPRLAAEKRHPDWAGRAALADAQSKNAENAVSRRPRLSVGARRPVATLLDPQDPGLTPLPWEEAQARIDAARFCFLTTLHTSGRPHTRPVLAVWAAGALCTTSAPTAQKGRNLMADLRCSVAIMADDMHIVLEGTALPVRGDALLEGVAEA